MAQGQRNFQIVFGVVVVVGVVFLASKLMGGKPVSIPANAVVTVADTAGFRGYVIGDSAAPIEITEYADFTCPGCGYFDQVQWPAVVTSLLNTGKARYRYRDFPLDGAEIHKNSRVASHAAACADEQGKFWEVKGMLFGRQTDWALRGDPMPVFKEIVEGSGLDYSKWLECMRSARFAGRIQASKDEGEKIGINETPSFLVGGRIYTGANSDMLTHLVDSLTALAPATQAVPKQP